MEDTGLSEEESKKIAGAIDDFTGSGFSDIRSAQQAGKTSGVSAESGKLIEEYIKNAPKWDGGDLYRFIVLNEEDIYDLIAAYDEDSEIEQFGTSSWTSSKDTAKGFVYATGNSDMFDDFDEKPYYVVFHTSGTKQGTSVRCFSATPYENEVIISKDARWKLTGYPYEWEETFCGEKIKICYVECEEV